MDTQIFREFSTMLPLFYEVEKIPEFSTIALVKCEGIAYFCSEINTSVLKSTTLQV